MSGMSDREKAEEAKYEHDTELAFKISVRRNKLIGEWAVSLLGLQGADAQGYIQSLIDMDVEGKTDADVIAKINADFSAKNVDQSEHQITRHLAEAKQQATTELTAG